MAGLLTKKWKCISYRKARTQHDKIKRMTYIQYIQQSFRKKKEKNKKINVYQQHNIINVAVPVVKILVV